MVGIAHAGEELIGLPAVAKHVLPRTHRGPLSPETIRLWATRGVRGVRLETVRVGRNRFTTRTAVVRFLDLINSNIPETSTPGAAVAAAPGISVELADGAIAVAPSQSPCE